MTVIVERIGDKALRVSAGDASTVVDGGAEGFRSVDLLLGALGACTTGTMLAAAAEASIPVTGVRVELRPVMTLEPERVSRIRMRMTLGGDLSESDVLKLKAAAETCKVHNSLHHGIETHLDMSVESALSA